MIEYTYLLNADNFYLCNMTDLKRTTFKTLKDDDKKTLLNRYLSLLVDEALSNNKPDFKIEVRMDINDDIVDISIGTAYPFIGRFDLSQPFNKSCVLDYLNDDNLILSGNGRTSNLVDFSKTRVCFTSHLFNKRLTEYLQFIANDLFPMVQENTIHYRIIAADKSFELTLCNNSPIQSNLFNAYPFLSQNIIFTINIEEDFDSSHIVKELDIFVNSQLQDPKANFFVLINDGLQFLETIKILENVLGFDNQLTSIYYKNSILKPINDISFFSIKHQKMELSLKMVSKSNTNIEIQISQTKLSFIFGELDEISESFTWLRTECMEHDTLMVRQFFIIYLEKMLGYKITDLKREIQLLEMDAI